MSALVHTLHAVLAGAWLGGVIFTTLVVSPALETIKRSEAERVLTRSEIGRRYAKVGSANLALLAVFAALDGLVDGFGALLYAEYALLAAVAALVAVHGAYFGKRLAGLAAAEREAPDAGAAAAFAERRRSLQRISLRASRLTLLVSATVAVLAVNA